MCEREYLSNKHTMSVDDAFGSDPFADFNAANDDAPKESSGGGGGTGGRSKGRQRRRASISTPSAEEASDASAAQQQPAGADGGRRRRGRRASVSTGSANHELGAMSTHSVESLETDFVDGNEHKEDHGAGGHGRRRGRRSSMGGNEDGNAEPGAATSYDAKFGGTKAATEDDDDQTKGSRPRVHRSRSKLDIDVNDLSNPSGGGGQVGAAPRQGNSMAMPIVVPDVEKNKGRRRGSMLGAVGSVAGAVSNAAVGAVVGGKSKLDDEEGGGRRRLLKDRSGGRGEGDEELPEASMSSERRRQGTMLERFS